MKTEILFNSNMLFEHENWKGELAFWKDELKFFNNRLSELVTRWRKKEILIQLEYYQNEFILHGGVIEDLLEAIQEYETRISRQSYSSTDALDTKLTKNHIEIRNQIESQSQFYAELKRDFFRFLEKYV